MNEQEKKYVAMLELALTDLMDGQRWWEIQEVTGLPTDRCYELEDLVFQLSKKQIPLDEME